MFCNNMDENERELLDKISQCNLPQLRKNFDECESHGEYQVRINTLQTAVIKLRQVLKLNPLGNDPYLTKVLSLVLIVYKELQSNGPWNPPNSIKMSEDLNNDFIEVNNVSLDKILCENSPYDKQKVFENCVLFLHTKLTSEKFKKNPSFIEVYYSIISNIDFLCYKVNPMMTLPSAMVLIDDFVESNKIKGLVCCKCVIEQLSFEDFNGGNYYDAVYVVLKKNVHEKNIDVIKLVLDCILEVLKILPEEDHSKAQKLDEILYIASDEILMETNFYRKKAYLLFLASLINIHKINCLSKKKKFMKIIIENVDLCVNTTMKSVLLDTLLDTIDVWLKYCWCAWRYKDDKTVITALLKILFIVEIKEHALIDHIQQIILLLYKLCSDDEQLEIATNVCVICAKIFDEEYLKKFKHIQAMICS